MDATGHVVLSPRGQATRVVDGPSSLKAYRQPRIGDPTLPPRGAVNTGGWNDYHIIARLPACCIQVINGQLIAVALDRRLEELRRRVTSC